MVNGNTFLNWIFNKANKNSRTGTINLSDYNLKDK